VPGYPATPIIALVIATIALIAISYYNPWLALVYLLILAVNYAWFKMFHRSD
jgi:ethanolamine permease